MSHLAGLVLTLDVGAHQLDDTLKSRHLQLLDENRKTTRIPCYGNGLTYRLEHQCHHDTAPRADFPWIGRSRFRRRHVTAQTCDTLIRDPATPSPWKMRREELVEALDICTFQSGTDGQCQNYGRPFWKLEKLVAICPTSPWA